MSSVFLLEIFRVLIPFGAAVAGWFVASNLQDRRERRKEIRSLIDEVKEIIQDSYKLTLEYYSPKNKTAINPLSAEIKLKNHLISQYFFVINQAGLQTAGAAEVINFVQLSTGGVFETSRHAERRGDMEWQSQFMAAAGELSMLLDKRYFDSFRVGSMPARYDLDNALNLESGWRDESWF